jgi:DNA-binding MarR family transcriptional regulator
MTTSYQREAITNSLTDDQRLARVGALLATGVSRLLFNRPTGDDFISDVAIADSKAAGTETKSGSDLLKFLSKVRSASPSEIRAKFGLTRTTAYRRLKALEDQGLVRRRGSSRDVVYEIAA